MVACTTKAVRQAVRRGLFGLYFKGRVNKIYCWIGCGVRENENEA